MKIFLIYDAKENERIDSDTDKIIESFPKVENENAINRANLNNEPNVRLFPRRRNKSYLSHNKFMILVRNSNPIRVYTGSTNISKGGIFGQTNVGHSVDIVTLQNNILSIGKSSKLILKAVLWKIYNSLGQKIEELFQKQLNYGTYEINYDAENLSSGIYFYELNGKDKREMKKFILIK